MRNIKTTTGSDIALDGDILAVMEALYREVTVKRRFERSFEDMVREIHHLIEQMNDEERRSYLAESLFLNTVKYENDRLEAYIRSLSAAPAALKRAAKKPAGKHSAKHSRARTKSRRKT